MKQKRCWAFSCVLAFIWALTGCTGEEAAFFPLDTGSATELRQSQTESSQTETSPSDQPLLSQPLPVETTPSSPSEIVSSRRGDTAMKINVQIGTSTFTATLEQNDAVDEWVEMMRSAPVTIQMNDYAGFEKVGSLGRNLPSSDQQTTTQPGDIVLYQSDQIVIFYGTNSWSYTRLGKIDNLSGWEEALGNENVTVTFSLSE